VATNCARRARIESPASFEAGLAEQIEMVAWERNQRYLQALVSLIPTLTALTPNTATVHVT